MGFVADTEQPTAAPHGFVPDTEPPKATAPSVLDRLGSAISNSPITGGAELLAHHISGALAPIPAMLAGSGAAVAHALGANVDANKVQADTENALTYAPASASGKAGMEGEHALVAPIAAAVKPITDKVSKAVDATGAAAPYIRSAGKAAGDAATLAAPLRGVIGDAAKAVDLSALSPEERAAFQARESTPTAPAQPATGAAKPAVGTGQTAIETGRSAGFKFTPGAVQSRMPDSDVPSSAGVTPNDRRAINLHNQARVTELAGEQIGAKPGSTSLSQKDFEDARKPHQKTYNETGAAVGSGRTGSEDFQNALTARLEDQTPTKLPGPVATQAQRVLKAAQSGNMSGPQMVKDISWFRANGGRSVAKMLEDEMETQLGANSPQLDKFREARTGFAQIKNLQDVTNGGQIDAGALARLDKKYPGLLTGNLKLIAQTAAAAPQDFRLPSGVVPGSSPISKPTIIGAAKGAGKAILKTVAPSRFNVQSDAFQNRFGRVGNDVENSYRRDLGKRPTAPTPGFTLQAPPGSAAIPPRQAAMQLPQGPPAAPKMDLAPPEGNVGVNPVQLGMEIAQGRPAAPKMDLAPPEGNVGVNPVQLGMEIAQGRPLGEQYLELQPTGGTIEPHQPSLLGHEGTPEGGSPGKGAKKRGKK